MWLDVNFNNWPNSRYKPVDFHQYDLVALLFTLRLSNSDVFDMNAGRVYYRGRKHNPP